MILTQNDLIKNVFIALLPLITHKKNSLNKIMCVSLKQIGVRSGFIISIPFQFPILHFKRHSNTFTAFSHIVLKVSIKSIAKCSKEKKSNSGNFRHSQDDGDDVLV